jgi:hypothetical protein
MSAEQATCLRCDWEGEGRGGSACPSCGAPLFVQRKAGEPRGKVDASASEPARRHPSGPMHSPATWPGRRDPRRVARAEPRYSADIDATDQVGPSRRSSPWRGVASFVTAIMVAAVVFAVIRGHESTVPSSTVPASSGTLVYAARGTNGSSRLFLWDLKNGLVSAGPSVLGLDSLTAADPLNLGWIGVITRSPSDVLTASTLRSLAPDAVLKPLLRGRLVAFDAMGSSVVGVTEGPTTRGCRHLLVVSAREVFTGGVDSQYWANTCDRVLTLARARGTTYMTRQRGHRISVDFVGFGVLHDILPGYALMSVSAASDMLVVSSRDMVGFPEATPPVLGASGPASVFFRGIGAPDPVPFAKGTDALTLGDVLAWSPDSTVALAFGRLGAEHGIFELAVGPGNSPRPPTFVAATSGPVWASYTDARTAFVSTGGQIYALRDHKLQPLSLPPGAPAPIGPVIWIR